MKSAPPLQTTRVILALMIREMITRYGRTAGGYIWALLEPVGMIAILSLAFSQFIHIPPLGQSFILFYATGYVPFHTYMETVNNTSGSIHVNRPLMEFPMVTPLDMVFARFLLSILTLIIVAAIVFTGAALILDTPIRVELAPFLSALGLAATLGLAVGTLNAVVFQFIPVWQQIWNIINRPLFIISGVFFTYDSMPEHLQAILWWNPLIHVIGLFRRAFYPIYDAEYVSVFYVLGVAGAAFLIGAALMARHRTFLVENR